MANDITYRLTEADEGLYVKEVLQRRFSLSSRLMRKIKISGQIALDGQKARLRDKGRSGQMLTVSFPKESSYFDPENIPLDVVYEDDDLLVVNKQPFLVVHPTKNYQSGTLANALAYRLQERGESWKIRFINRLDRDTSGLVLVAKNGHAQDAVSAQMEQGTTEKKYLALVHGLFEETEGRIDAPIDKDPDHKARRMVREDGYPSVTLYKVLDSWNAGSRPGFYALAGRKAHRRLQFGGTYTADRPHPSDPGAPHASRPPHRGRRTLWTAVRLRSRNGCLEPPGAARLQPAAETASNGRTHTFANTDAGRHKGLHRKDRTL